MGGCPAVGTAGQYTHHPRCPHLISTLQRMVDEVSLRMWMPGQCLGTTPILLRGLGGPRAGAMAAPPPHVDVYPTRCGDVTQLVAPPHPSTRRCRRFDATTWETYKLRTTGSKGSGP